MALVNLIHGLGAADTGCPITPQGDCVLNGMPVSCSLIRECDSLTGNLHYEYAMPYSTGNVNINVADTQGNLVGYNDQQGRFVDTADVPISSLTSAPSSANATQEAIDAIERAKAKAVRESADRGLNSLQTALAVSMAAATAALNMPKAVNTQAGFVTGAIVNTPQTTTSQQGRPSATTVTNTNASTNNGGAGGSNSVTPSSPTNNSTGMNFSELLNQGSNWLEGETWGIKNSWLAVGGLLAVAVGGGYIGGKTRKGF